MKLLIPPPYPCLEPRGQQLTKNGEKENNKNLSILYRGNKHYQLKGEVSSLKCSLFNSDYYYVSSSDILHRVSLLIDTFI